MKITPPYRRFSRQDRVNAFSLIEVVMALAITAFATTSIISLVPVGLGTFRQAMNNTVESQIVQSLTNDIAMTDFKDLKKMAGSQAAVYYFDADGLPLASATSGTGVVYTAQISFVDLSTSQPNAVNPLNIPTQSVGTTASITITKLDKTRDYFSVVIGNNQQVDGNATAATW